jgi:4-alpha-glucanotransferase
MWGIEPEYWDTWGNRHVTAPEIEKAILAALGVSSETGEDLDRARERLLLEQWDRLLPPVHVAGESAPGFPLCAPESLAEAAATLEIRWEDGAAERRELRLAELAAEERAEFGGIAYVRKRVPLPGARRGYHRVEVAVADRRASMRLILCPDRAYVPPVLHNGGRAAGLAVSLYSLRSRRNWGCGDFADLEALIGWAAESLGVAFIGLNPLHAIPNRQPFNISPYLPSSIFYRNPIYLDVSRVAGFEESKRLAAWLRHPEVQAEIEALRASPLVEYERVWGLKLHALKLAFASFLLRPARAFEEYLAREGSLLERYATWCALEECIHRSHPEVWVWQDWPEKYRDPDSEATREFARKHWRLVRFYEYLQWQVDVQLAAAQRCARERGLPIGLYHDLALATDRSGADLWAYRPFYAAGCRVGAPPDGFSPKGQDWSFPPPNAARHRETGYRLFAESIRRNARHGGALRIDHVMRFFRLYWIPESMDPAHGAYVSYRAADWLHILALESARESVLVVGEDLGTVTGEIRQALDSFGLYGYRVPFFEKNGNGAFRPPAEYTEQAMVASSTHDLPTLAGFWLGRDIEARHGAGLLDDAARDRAHAERAADKQKLGWLARARSRLVVVTQDDLFQETEQQNLPATVSEHPNWRRKMRFTVEELAAGAAREYTERFRGWLAPREAAG